jgi:hypothetical protein
MAVTSEANDSQPGFVTEEVNEIALSTTDLIVESVRFLWGSAFRYHLSCGIWTLIYLGVDKMKKVPAEKSKQKAKARLNMWSRSFWLEAAVSLGTVPGRYLTGKTAPRLLFDFTFMQWGDNLSIFDRFHPRNYIFYALNRLTPSGEWDLSFFLWQLPATLASGYKLYKRRQTAPEHTKTGRCAAAMFVQYFNRILLISFAVSLPRSLDELIFAAALTGLDKYLDAYIIRNTWPNATDIATLADVKVVA